MNIKYSTSEMNFEGKFPIDYPYLRVFETQLLFLNATHIPLQKILNSNKKYKGDLLFNIGKGDFNKPYISFLYQIGDIVSILKEKFDNVYIYQDGEIGWWNQVDVKLQVWWYNNISKADSIFVPNSTDKSYYQGILPSNIKVKVIRSVMTDQGLNLKNLKSKEDRIIINGPFTMEYNALSQVLLAHSTGMEIDIPPMGESRMPKDSWEMASSIGVNYLQYMSWIDWMYNLNRYKIGYMLMPSAASGSFALNCGYLGIPCIGYQKADTQRLLFPDLSIDVYDNKKALDLTNKLISDSSFYNYVSNYAKQSYIKNFSKQEMIKILNN